MLPSDAGQQNATAPTVSGILLAGEIITAGVVSPAAAGESVAIAKQKDPTTPTAPDVVVGGYQDVVVEKLGKDVDHLVFKPSVQAQ